MTSSEDGRQPGRAWARVSPFRPTDGGAPARLPSMYDNDDRMIEPGAHENVAHNDLADDRTADAQVRALLAIASAINRVADQLEGLAAARM